MASAAGYGECDDEFWADREVLDQDEIPDQDSAAAAAPADCDDEFWADSELLDQDIAAAAPAGLDSETIVIIKAGFTKIDATGVFVDRDGKERQELRRKGEELVPHIIQVEERQVRGTSTINAKCIRQQSIFTKKPFNVHIQVDLVTRKWLSGRCGPDCPTGAQGKCKHTYALVHYINSERTEACTDNEGRWVKPSEAIQALYPKGMTTQVRSKCNNCPFVTNCL